MEPHVESVPKGFTIVANVAKGLAIVGVAVALVLTVRSFLTAKAGWSQEFEERLLALERTGTVTETVVTHRREKQSMDGHSIRVDHFEFSFPLDRLEPDGRRHVTTRQAVREELLSEEAQLFDFRGLEAFIRNDCVLLETKPRRFWQGKKAVPCRRAGIELRFDPGDPNEFFLPGFRPRSSLWQRLGGFLVAFLYAVVYTAICSLVAFLGLVLFHLFLGMPKPTIDWLD